jgi:hypothetical protein
MRKRCVFTASAVKGIDFIERAPMALFACTARPQRPDKGRAASCYHLFRTKGMIAPGSTQLRQSRQFLYGLRASHTSAVSRQ